MKTRKYCKQFALLILLFFLTGCLGSPVSKYQPSPGRTKPGHVLTPIDITINSVEAPSIPASLTENSLSSMGLSNDSSWGRSGAFKIIPQIAHNYNTYMEKSIDKLLTNMLVLTPEEEQIRVNGYLTTVTYEDVENHSVFDRKLTFVNDRTSEIEAILYRNKTGNRLNLIIRSRSDEREVRQVIFQEFSTGKHTILLYYRREAITPDNKISDMNGIVEVWETSEAKHVKDVRVYNLSRSEQDQSIVNFAAYTYKTPLLETTARYFHNLPVDRYQLREIYESPAIFNDQEKYIRSLKEGELVEGYPDANKALEVYQKGIDHHIVRDARVNIETLESNLWNLIF